MNTLPALIAANMYIVSEGQHLTTSHARKEILSSTRLYQISLH